MHHLRRAAVLVALVAIWAFSGSDRTPPTLIASEAFAAPVRPAEDPSSRSPHELSALKVMTKIILYVKDNYVDPKRVKPRDMMVAALEAVEQQVPEVMVDSTQADQNKVRIDVAGKSKEFDISTVDSLWKMSFTLKDVFDFVAKNMRPSEDTRDIEYAAVNGMLQTLDPHSLLLRPEMYREMKLTTKGEFGGLGFVIQMREGVLTVVKVLPKTPAFRASIKKDDQILKIGEESTVNMDLNEAVGKLRGPPDTKVTITVNRKGWEAPKVLSVQRAIITIESVQSKLLSSNVGYVRLKNFQGNTTRDLEEALQTMANQARSQGSPQGLKGLVLDLRGNPGGLLEQAITVSDLFLSSGPIVATVGYFDKMREEKVAHRDPEDDSYPVAVLVNAGSASASEIVAGALKNLNRAVVIGRQTFGKGSVQVLYELPDDSALKLTIAKYLTPGDKSIQEIGIVPDIQLIPTRVTRDRVDVFAPRRTVGEADLDRHFGNPDSKSAVKKKDDLVLAEKPAETLKYLKEREKKAEPKDAALKKGKGVKPHLPDDELPDEELDDQLDADTQDSVREDFEVTFAKEFLLTAPFVKRDQMLAAGRAFVAEQRRREESRIAEAIGALGVDWTAGQTPRKVSLDLGLKPGPDRQLTAGESGTLELTVENRGPEAVRRLRAWTESDNGLLDRREFLFGLLRPGEKRTWTVPFSVPKNIVSRRDGVTVKLQDDSGLLQEVAQSEVAFVELPRPQFAFGWSVVDDCAACNGDGQVQRGESVSLYLDVKNVGGGPALDTFATIRNLGDPNVFIEKGRFKLGELAPGETRSARFQLELKKGYRGDSFALRVGMLDEPLDEYTADKLDIPVAADAPPPGFDARKAVVRVAERAEVFSSADLKSPLARLVKGGVFTELGRAGAVAKLEWEKDRPVFVKASDLREAKGQKPGPVKEAEYSLFRTPAQIALNVDTTSGGLVVESERFSLSGAVSDPKLLDVFVLVNDQKVLFKGHAQDDGPTLRFVSEVPLREGNNLVTVVARESADFATRRTIVVRRRPAAVAQQVTPVTEGKP